MKDNIKEISDKERIRREVTRGKYGLIFTPSSFPWLTANYATKLLSAFEKEGLLVRVAKGVYLKAKRTRFGISYPPIEEIVSQIAKRRQGKDISYRGYSSKHAWILGTGSNENCFLTSGTARDLNIGGRIVELKRLRQEFCIQQRNNGCSGAGAQVYQGRKHNR